MKLLLFQVFVILLMAMLQKAQWNLSGYHSGNL